MKTYATSQLRTVSLVGHSGVGKTTLIESILHLNKMIDRVGTVEAGTTQSDYDAEEIRRRASINATVFPIERDGVKFNLIDCPGFQDFVSEIKSCLRISDMAVVVVDAIHGAEVGTEFAWAYCEEYEIPHCVFINKMDKERADFTHAMETIHDTFGSHVVPLTLPIGKESTLSGVVDLVKMKARVHRGGKMEWTEIPDSMKEEAKAARARVIEAAAEGDDTLTEKFLTEDTLTDAEVMLGLREAFVAGKFIPALCGSATQEFGITILQDFICTLAPTPMETHGMEVEFVPTKEKRVQQFKEDEPVVAFVFKTVNDDYAGRLSFIKVLSGVLTPETSLVNVATGKQERVSHIYTMLGKKHIDVAKLHAGDIGALAKLDGVHTNHTLVDAKSIPLRVSPTKLPEPCVFMTVVPKTKSDEDKIAMAIHRLREADPSLHLERDAALHQTILSGMGDTHLDVVIGHLHNSKIEVTLEEPKINFRETLTRKAEGQGRHKKQTGGRGQFGDCWIRLEPLPRGEGFKFEWAVVGGAIPSNYAKAIEKGLVDAMSRGIQAGYPAVDIKAVCYDGSYHAVDSSDMAFQLAAIKAFRNVSAQCGPIVLEPYMNVTVRAPEAFMGDVLASLSGKRGRIINSSNEARKCVIEAQVPQMELAHYSRELRSLSHGRGTFEMTFSHFEPTPPHIQSQLVSQAGKIKEDEE